MHWLEPLRRGAGEILETFAEGWERLRRRSAGALTRFRRKRSEEEAGVPLPAETFGLLAAEVAETPDALVIRLEAPGMREEDFEVLCTDRHVVIRGEKRFQREEKDANYLVFESAYGAFERALPLPFPVRPEGAEARYRRGVLTVRIPRAAERRERRIPVRVAR